MYYKMINSLTPNYLSDLIQVSVADQTSYKFRSSNNIGETYCRTRLYYDSFLPSATREWNQLPEDIRNSSLSIFKSKLQGNVRRMAVSSHYYVGERTAQVLHTRIRNHCSALNEYLYSKKYRWKSKL